MTSPEPQVSIIVVTHNSLPALTLCLDSLVEEMLSIPCELIVVDNASEDASRDEVAKRFPRARIIANDSNLGFAAACNLGAKKATTEYLLFLNPDVQIDQDAVGKLQQVLDSRRDAGLVAGRMRFPDGQFQATCRRFPTAGNMLFSRGSVLSRLFGRGEQSSRYTLLDYAETTEVPAVAATMVMMKRKLFEDAGGFDTRFFMYMEDTDLSLRVSQAGYVNFFVPSAGGIHVWGQGSKAGKSSRRWQHHWSVWKYFLKHSPNGFSLIVLPAMLLLNLLLSMLFQRSGEE